MKRYVLSLVCLLGLLAALAAALRSGVRTDVEGDRVYTVREVRKTLLEHRAALLGSTVRVRGMAWRCLAWAYGPCLVRAPLLFDPDAGAVLALGHHPENSMLTFVRALPAVGRVMPMRQPIRWGVLTTYHVELRAVPPAACTYWPCYEAVILDAAP